MFYIRIHISSHIDINVMNSNAPLARTEPSAAGEGGEVKGRLQADIEGLVGLGSLIFSEMLRGLLNTHPIFTLAII